MSHIRLRKSLGCCLSTIRSPPSITKSRHPTALPDGSICTAPAAHAPPLGDITDPKIEPRAYLIWPLQTIPVYVDACPTSIENFIAAEVVKREPLLCVGERSWTAAVSGWDDTCNLPLTSWEGTTNRIARRARHLHINICIYISRSRSTASDAIVRSPSALGRRQHFPHRLMLSPCAPILVGLTL